MAKGIKATPAKATPTKATTSAPAARKEGNPFVAITAILAVFFTVIVALVLVFTSDSGVLVPIAIAFIVIGWIMAYYANKREQR